MKIKYPEIESLLEYLKKILIENLSDNLVGIYIHGSLTMDCFNPQTSDVDFLIIIKEKVSIQVRRKIVDLIIQAQDQNIISDQKLEFSMVLKDVLEQDLYEVPFELHYSNEHNSRYRADPNYFCGDSVDQDLPAHFTITLNRGFTFFGDPIDKVFKPVSKSNYVKSLRYDLENIQRDIYNDPIYYIFSMVRILYYLREGVINSKREGAEWALQNLPEKYHSTIKKALTSYIRNESVKFKQAELNKFLELLNSEELS